MAIDSSTVPMISRNRMFHDSLKRVTAGLLENDTVKHVGGKASGNSYCAGVTRQRVRALAKTMARDEMRSIRKK